MIYKNNYQRKQAIWREKWLAKEEKRLKRSDLERLGREVAKCVKTVKEASVMVLDGINEILATAGDIVNGLRR